MNQKSQRPSPALLVLMTLIAILALGVVERSKLSVRQRYYRQKVDAANLAVAAREAIKEVRQERGLAIDIENDPNETGLIGEQFSLITTDRSNIDTKLLAADPNFAAVMVDMLKGAGLGEGDKLAVGITGSFPSLNIALYAAMHVLRLEPIIITSVGASMWGANVPSLTWLDMEEALREKGIFPFRSVAASLGGGSDRGRGLSPRGRELIQENIAAHGIELIGETLLSKSIARRMEIYDREAGKGEIRAYINIGGGASVLGSTEVGLLVPTGLSRQLPEIPLEPKGVLVRMGERGIPIIHVLKIEELVEKYGLVASPSTLPAAGEGEVFIKERYSVPVAAVASIVVLALLIALARVDLAHRLLRGRRGSGRRASDTPDRGQSPAR